MLMVIYDPPSWIKPVSPQFQPVQDFLQGRVILFLRMVLWKMVFGFIELTAYFAAEAPAPSRSAQQCRKWEWGIRTSPALVIQRTCSWEYKKRSIHSEGKMRERERTQKETEFKAKRVAVCVFKCVCVCVSYFVWVCKHVPEARQALALRLSKLLRHLPMK